MIHYHGGPITPLNVAASVWTTRHAFVSFERPEQIAFAAEVCQSFALDNGAFSVWKQGGQLDVRAYAAWVNEWRRHPGFDFALIPDVIDGDEVDQDRLFAEYRNAGGDLLADVPVWHMHESLARLGRLCRTFPRVALGSSGQWSDVGTTSWWERMAEAMAFVCDADGRPPCKLHGLRMLNPAVFSRLPLASADSTNVARNHARERKLYRLTDAMGALAVVDRIERHACAPRWGFDVIPQPELELIGL